MYMRLVHLKMSHFGEKINPLHNVISYGLRNSHVQNDQILRGPRRLEHTTPENDRNE